MKPKSTLPQPPNSPVEPTHVPVSKPPRFQVHLVCRDTAIATPPKQIRIPQDVSDLLHSEIAPLDREVFYVIYLDTRNRVIGYELVSQGTLSASLVHPREIFKGAILANANAVILSHNHPSGDVTPSEEDITLNRRLSKAGELLGIEVLDHVILSASSKFHSMKEDGK